MFLFQFRNYFKYIWQRLGNAPSANLKKSNYSSLAIPNFGTKRYLLPTDRRFRSFECLRRKASTGHLLWVPSLRLPRDSEGGALRGP